VRVSLLFSGRENFNEGYETITSLIEKDDILIKAGAYDALSEKIIEQAGIQATYTTGFGISASYLGEPNAELYIVAENLKIVKNIAFPSWPT
jgi:2-methylisocitrate lyase-like PEP mutase family enzyme